VSSLPLRIDIKIQNYGMIIARSLGKSNKCCNFNLECDYFTGKNQIIDSAFGSGYDYSDAPDCAPDCDLDAPSGPVDEPAVAASASEDMPVAIERRQVGNLQEIAVASPSAEEVRWG
jgi:hypothetical protein